MPGIKGLNKGDRPKVENRAGRIFNPKEAKRAEEFISGAKKRSDQVGKSKRSRVYERYTFSLTPDISEDIDKLSYLPSTFRASRSDVLKAAILLLKNMDKKEIVMQLNKVI